MPFRPMVGRPHPSATGGRRYRPGYRNPRVHLRLLAQLRATHGHRQVLALLELRVVQDRLVRVPMARRPVLVQLVIPHRGAPKGSGYGHLVVLPAPPAATYLAKARPRHQRAARRLPLPLQAAAVRSRAPSMLRFRSAWPMVLAASLVGQRPGQPTAQSWTISPFA